MQEPMTIRCDSISANSGNFDEAMRDILVWALGDGRQAMGPMAVAERGEVGGSWVNGDEAAEISASEPSLYEVYRCLSRMTYSGYGRFATETGTTWWAESWAEGYDRLLAAGYPGSDAGRRCRERVDED